MIKFQSYKKILIKIYIKERYVFFKKDKLGQFHAPVHT